MIRHYSKFLILLHFLWYIPAFSMEQRPWASGSMPSSAQVAPVQSISGKTEQNEAQIAAKTVQGDLIARPTLNVSIGNSGNEPFTKYDTLVNAIQNLIDADQKDDLCAVQSAKALLLEQIKAHITIMKKQASSVEEFMQYDAELVGATEDAHKILVKHGLHDFDSVTHMLEQFWNEEDTHLKVDEKDSKLPEIDVKDAQKKADETAQENKKVYRVSQDTKVHDLRKNARWVELFNAAMLYDRVDKLQEKKGLYDVMKHCALYFMEYKAAQIIHQFKQDGINVDYLIKVDAPTRFVCIFNGSSNRIAPAFNLFQDVFLLVHPTGNLSIADMVAYFENIDRRYNSSSNAFEIVLESLKNLPIQDAKKYVHSRTDLKDEFRALLNQILDMIATKMEERQCKRDEIIKKLCQVKKAKEDEKNKQERDQALAIKKDDAVHPEVKAAAPQHPIAYKKLENINTTDSAIRFHAFCKAFGLLLKFTFCHEPHEIKKIVARQNVMDSWLRYISFYKNNGVSIEQFVQMIKDPIKYGMPQQPNIYGLLSSPFYFFDEMKRHLIVFEKDSLEEMIEKAYREIDHKKIIPDMEFFESLMDAIRVNDVVKVTSLIRKKPSLINEKNEMGNTPLFFAILHNHGAIVEQLLNNGADINVTDFGGIMPSMLVEYVPKVRIPFARNVPRGTKALLLRQMNEAHNQKTVEYLLKNKKLNLDVINKDGNTPLMVAINFGNIYELDLNKCVIEALLKLGASINAPGAHRTTPLMAVCKTAKPALIELMIKAGADPLLRDSSGQTALHSAAAVPCFMAVKILCTALEQKFSNTMVKRMMEAHDNNGNTPYILAQALQKKACDTTKDPWCNSPCDHALLVEYLRDHDINAVDDDGRTALMAACSAGNVFAVQSLLSRKANVALKGSRNQTAYQLAKKGLKRAKNDQIASYNEIIRLLVEAGAEKCEVDTHVNMPAIQQANKESNKQEYSKSDLKDKEQKESKHARKANKQKLRLERRKLKCAQTLKDTTQKDKITGACTHPFGHCVNSICRVSAGLKAREMARSLWISHGMPCLNDFVHIPPCNKFLRDQHKDSSQLNWCLQHVEAMMKEINNGASHTCSVCTEDSIKKAFQEFNRLLDIQRGREKYCLHCRQII